MATIFYMDVTPLLNQINYDRSMRFIGEYRKNKVKAARLMKNKILSLAAGLLFSYAVLLYQKNDQKWKSSVCLMDLQHLLEIFENEHSFWWEEWMKTEETPNGKPYLKNHSDLFFSLSHSGEYAILALSKKQVGVDIQKWKPVSEGFQKRLLHEQESFVQREEQIFATWTAKEAFVKCTGEGLHKDFRQLYTDFDKGCVTDTKTGMSLPVIQLDLLSGYSVSVCSSEITKQNNLFTLKD